MPVKAATLIHVWLRSVTPSEAQLMSASPAEPSQAQLALLCQAASSNPALPSLGKQDIQYVGSLAKRRSALLCHAMLSLG